MKSKTNTEVFAARMIGALRNARAPIATEKLEKLAGCNKRQVSMVIGWARRFLETTEKNTIHNTRGVGYRICGMGTPNTYRYNQGALVLPANKQHDLVDEQTKIAGRIVSHAKRHERIGSLIDPSKITDIDYMQAVGMNAALGSFVKGFIAFDGQIKAMLRPGAREIVALNQGQGGAPLARFGLESAPRCNRADPQSYDDDEEA